MGYQYRKSSKLWLTIFIGWLLICFTVLKSLSIRELPVFLFLALFWFYGIFNLSVFVVSHFVKSKVPSLPNPNPHPLKVAILYCCYNDFSENALKSILQLNYESKTVYILDDSTDNSVRNQIDNFANKYGVKVLRRKERKGWKAGAINNALEKVDADYIVLADSDEILPRDFIEKTLAYFSDPKIAFVQANHYCYSEENEWVKLMGVGVDLHWNHYQEYRNKYGLVQLLGHGAIIRADVLKKLGGFPEVVSEDLALTLKLAQNGFRGVFAKDVVWGVFSSKLF